MGRAKAAHIKKAVETKGLLVETNTNKRFMALSLVGLLVRLKEAGCCVMDGKQCCIYTQLAILSAGHLDTDCLGEHRESTAANNNL